MKIRSGLFSVVGMFMLVGTGTMEAAQALASKGKLSGSAGAATELLGSPKFLPSPERPVGWRGDGTGRYPAATPPTTWSRKKTAAGYETTGILWMTPLPNSAVSSPIVVGDRVFVTAEGADDLVCLDKQSGRILWIRSNPECEAMSEADRKANPAYAEKLDPLVAQLVKVNEEVAEQLNAQIAAAPTSARQAPPALAKKHDLEKQIMHEQLEIYGKNEYKRYGAQGVFGYAGPTPASDGKCVYAFYSTGVSVCYDLDGTRVWAAFGKGGGAEHGNFASPLLCENQFIVWGGFETRSYDAQSGKLLWSNGDQGGNTYGSMFRIPVGNETVAAFQNGFFSRIRDGQLIWDKHIFADQTATPIVEGNLIYAYSGVFKDAGLKAYRIPASTDGGKLKLEFVCKSNWPDDFAEKDFKRGTTASPLYVNGLIYQLTEGGGLMVNDATNGEVVYRQILPMKPRTSYWDWAGASISPTLAGKYIYLMDNQGTTIVIEPGRQYKEVATNNIQEVERDDWQAKGGKSQNQMLATPVFDGTRIYLRTPSYLYCIGSK